MSLFFQENITAFLIGAGILGFIAGHILHPFIRYVPRKLEKNWRRQAWEYFHPDTKIPMPFTSPNIEPCSLKKMQSTACVFAAASVSIAYVFGPHWTALANIVLMWGLLLLAYIDYYTYLLPDCLTLPLLWLGLFCNTFALCVPLRDAVLGAIIGYSSLWLVATSFRYLRKKEGMGQGDFKLLAVFGAWWGWEALPFIVMLASTLGATIGLIQIAKGQAAEKQIAFGPYLIFAGFICLLFKQYLC